MKSSLDKYFRLQTLGTSHLRVSLSQILALRVSYLRRKERTSHGLGLGLFFSHYLSMHPLLHHGTIHFELLVLHFLPDRVLVESLELHHGASHGIPLHCGELALLHFKYYLHG